MQLQVTKEQRMKAIVHFVQAFLIFIAACLTIAVMTKKGGFGGPTSFYFALCFFTIPAITYQVIVPIWSRAWRLNNVWAFAAVDITYALLWFAASVAVAAWNANGIAKGKDDTSDKSNEKHTKDTASTSKIQTSEASVGLGIVIFFLFAFTSYLSIRAVIDYRRTGVVPNGPIKNFGDAEGLDGPDPGKDAWSANTDELDYGSGNDRLTFAQNAEQADKEGLLDRRSFDTSVPADGMHPGRKMHEAPQPLASPVYDETLVPSALSPTGLPTSPNGRVQFPEANYSALR